MKERIARSVFWMVWSRGGIQLVSFLSTVIVARLLTPSDYGLMALAGIWTGIIGMAASLGLGGAIVQFRNLEESELNACFWMTLAVACLGYAGLYTAAPFLAAWFESPMLSAVLRVAGLSLPLTVVGLIPDALLRKELELDKIAQAEILASFSIIPVMLGLALAGAGVWALVIGTLMQAVVHDVAVFWFKPWRPGFRMWSRRMREVLHYSFSTLGVNLGWSAYAQIDSFILGKVAGEQMLGFYSMAKQLGTLPVTKISVVVNQLAWPVMAQLQTDRALLRASFLKVLRLVACVAMPISLGMAVVAHDLVSVVLGQKWSPVVPLFQVFCLYAVLHSLEVLLPPVLYARYRTSFLFRWTTAVLLFMPLPFWAGAVWNGAFGIALVWLVVYPIFIAVMARETLRELDLGWATIGDQIRPVIGAVLLMALAAFVAGWAISGYDPMDHLVRLVLASGIGALVYALGIRLHGRRLIDEVWEVVRWVIRPAKRAAVEK